MMHREALQLRLKVIAMLVACLMCAGCQTAPTENPLSAASIQQHRLPPLEDGCTTRQQITAALGEPSMQFEHGRIVIYRIALIENPGPPPVEESPYGVTPAEAPRRRSGNYVWQRDVAEHGELRVMRDRASASEWRTGAAAPAEFSLVLVFDQRNTLARHNFTSIVRS